MFTLNKKAEKTRAARGSVDGAPSGAHPPVFENFPAARSLGNARLRASNACNSNNHNHGSEQRRIKPGRSRALTHSLTHTAYPINKHPSTYIGVYGNTHIPPGCEEYKNNPSRV